MLTLDALTLRILVMAVAQFLDLGTFIRMVATRGMSAEANPIVVRIADAGGLGGLFLVKGLVVVLAASAVFIIGRRIPYRWAPALASLIVVVGIVGGILGGWSNALSILAG